MDASAIELVGVGTQPDRPAARRRRLRPTPIAEFAAEQGLSVDKPESVNRPEFIEHLRRLDPELVVVLSFGQILKQPLLELSPFGCLNVHFSLLPRHRGASPMAAAILAGDAETGISFMRMDRGLDTGPVYRRISVSLDGRETTADLEERLRQLAAEHVYDCVWSVCREGLRPKPQPLEGSTYAPRICKQNAAVDWALPSEQIDRIVRAYYPWPKAYFFVDVKGVRRRLQLTRAESTTLSRSGQDPLPGQVVEAGREAWTVACGRGALRLLEVVPEGRRPMAAPAYLRGHPIPVGTMLLSADQHQENS